MKQISKVFKGQNDQLTRADRKEIEEEIKGTLYENLEATFDHLYDKHSLSLERRE